jgi:hypothetical protein
VQLIVAQLVKISPAFHGTRIPLIKRVRQRTAHDSVACSPHHVSSTSILILFSHLRLGLPSSVFPSRFPTTIAHACYMPPALISITEPQDVLRSERVPGQTCYSNTSFTEQTIKTVASVYRLGYHVTEGQRLQRTQDRTWIALYCATRRDAVGLAQSHLHWTSVGRSGQPTGGDAASGLSVWL